MLTVGTFATMKKKGSQSFYGILQWFSITWKCLELRPLLYEEQVFFSETEIYLPIDYMWIIIPRIFFKPWIKNKTLELSSLSSEYKHKPIYIIMVSHRSLDVLCISQPWKWRITTEQVSCLTKIRVNAFLCYSFLNCVLFKLESLAFCFLQVWYARDWGLFKSRSIRMLMNFCWKHQFLLMLY